MPDWRTEARAFLTARLQDTSPLDAPAVSPPVPDWRASALAFLDERDTPASSLASASGTSYAGLVPEPVASGQASAPARPAFDYNTAGDFAPPPAYNRPAPPAQPSVLPPDPATGWAGVQASDDALATRTTKTTPTTPAAPFNSPRFAGLAKVEATTPFVDTGITPAGGRTLLGTVQDIGITAAKAAIGLPEMVVGLADIPTLGYVGKALHAAGFKPDVAKQILESYYSDPQRRAKLKVAEAEGVIGTATAALSNPSVIAETVGESLPQMGAGGIFGRGLLRAAPRVATWAAGALGEGVVTAGQNAEQVRQASPTGRLTVGQAAQQTAAGLITGGLSLLGGKIANRLGIADADTMLVAGLVTPAARHGLTKSLIYGAVQEGLLEELPQSVQEQVWQNISLGKPWEEGVDQAAVLGALAGVVMGGGVQGIERVMPGPSGAAGQAPQAGPVPPPAPPVQAETADTPPTAPPVDIRRPGRVTLPPLAPQETAPAPSLANLARPSAPTPTVETPAQPAVTPIVPMTAKVVFPGIYVEPAEGAPGFLLWKGESGKPAQGSILVDTEYGGTGIVKESRSFPPRQGIGSELYQAAAKYAGDIGLAGIEGDTDQNEASRALWASLERRGIARNGVLLASNPSTVDVAPQPPSDPATDKTAIKAEMKRRMQEKGILPAETAAITGQPSETATAAKESDKYPVYQDGRNYYAQIGPKEFVEVKVKGDGSLVYEGAQTKTLKTLTPEDAFGPHAGDFEIKNVPTPKAQPAAGTEVVPGPRFAPPTTAQLGADAGARKTTAEGAMAPAPYTSLAGLSDQAVSRLTMEGNKAERELAFTEQRRRQAEAPMPSEQAAAAPAQGDAAMAAKLRLRREYLRREIDNGEQWLAKQPVNAQNGAIAKARREQIRRLQIDLEPVEARLREIGGMPDAEMGQPAVEKAADVVPTVASGEWQKGPKAEFRVMADVDGAYQLRFPSKPAPHILQQLRAGGWKWTPGAKVWRHGPGPGVADSAYNVTGVARPETGPASVATWTKATIIPTRTGIKTEVTESGGFKVGDRVSVQEGFGEVQRFDASRENVIIRLDDGGRLSNHIPVSRVTHLEVDPETPAAKPVTPQVAPDWEATPLGVAPSKYEAAKAALDAEEDEVWKKIRSKLNQATTGIDPELAGLAVDLLGIYAKRGVNEFQEAIRLAVEKVGRPLVEQMAVYLDAGWELLHDTEVSTHAVLTTLPAEPTLAGEATDENSPVGSGQEGQPGDDGRDGRGDAEAGVGPGVGADSSASPESRPGARTGQRGTVPGRARKPRTGGVETTPALAPDLYRITDKDAIGTGSAKERVSTNLAAIRIVKALEAENRPATPEEQATLVRYVGWGGLSRIFEYWKNEDAEADNTTNEYWRKQNEALKELLTDEEYHQARNSTQNAHYTSPTVIGGMWDAVRHLGAKSGSALETSAGIGHFTGMTPDALRSMAWAMIEKDGISAAIAKALYPGAFVQHSPFEKATLPDNHFAVAISNVPFGLIPITDPNWSGPAFMRHRIHNYFFGKALDKVAPGGLVAFVTTQGTLDSRDNENVRKYLASRADFVGAIRLPYTAFKKNAGTEVVTDMIFLRKRHEGEEPKHAGPWFTSQRVMLPNKDGVDVEQWVNEYILKHPKMVLGKHASTGKKRAADQYNVEPTGDLAAQLTEAVRRLPKGIIDLKPPKESLKAFTQAQAPIGTRPYEFLIHEGRLAQNVNGEAVAAELSGTDEARVRAILPIRVAVRNVYDLMATGASDADVTAAQKALASAYDGFVKKHGFLSLRQNHWAFREDPDFPLLLSLEDYDAERDTATKTPIFTKRTIAAEQKLKTADTPDKALYISLGETGRVDLDRIGELLGVSADQAAADLEGAGLLLKTPSGYQLPAVYLSGNVRVKLREAEAAAAIDPTYQPAVDRLTAVIPADLEPYKIDVKLGAPWVPVEAVQGFVNSATTGRGTWTVAYNPVNAQWAIEGKAAERNSRFETPDVDTKTLLLDALNDRRRRIRETHEGVTVDNRAATALARQRKADIHKAFAAWLFNEDQDRSKAMSRLYNDIYSASVDPAIDGKYLTFPGMADYWREVMAGHQKDAAARVLLLGNTYLDHVVGSGKTLTMVSTLMELKRLGNARKPMMVVPNHLISQTPGQFLQYYPNAKILVAYKEDLEEANRKRFTARIAAGDWDAVIMPFSSFVKVSMSVEAEMAYQREILDEVEAAILEAELVEAESVGRHERHGRRRGTKSPTVKNLERTRDTIQAKLDKLAARPKDDLLTFEQLGVDALFVDEAHGFKNLYFPTRQQAAGIPQGTIVQRATDLYLKARYINQQSNYRNLVLASGTPVSNSLAEMFVAQKLLQDPALDRSGIGTLDAWLAQFGLIETKTELAPSGTGMKARAVLTKLRNAPDLAKLFRQVFDVKTIDDLPDLKMLRPKVKGGGPEIVEVPISEYQSQALTALAHRADHLDPRDKRTDNMAMITTDGRMLMLDPRLIDRTLPEAPGSKISTVAEKVAAIWKETKAEKGTQLVFLDSGTPGSEVRPQFKEAQDPVTGNTIKRPLTDAEKVRGFDLYADLKKKLVKLGVKANEIAFIHDIDKLPDKQQDGARQSLFRNVRNGVVRVLVGSTEKMGTGMNVQDRGVALHNVDATWTPAGLEQRIGRFLRQGNIFFQADPEGFELRILNYLTVGSGTQFGFDSYMWQLNERKAKGIAQLFDGTSTSRSVSTDMGATALTAAQMKAVATGNPLVIDLGQAMETVDQLELTQMGFEQSQREAEWGLDNARKSLRSEEQAQERETTTAAVIKSHEPGTALKAMINGVGELEGHKVIGEAIISAAKKATTASDQSPGEWKSYQGRAVLGTIRGMTIALEGNGKTIPHLTLRHPEDVPQKYYEDKADSTYVSVRIPLLTADKDGPGGMNWAPPVPVMMKAMNALDAILEGGGGNPKHWRGRWMEEQRAKIASYESILNQSFDQQADLDAAYAKVEELSIALGLPVPRRGQQEEVVQDDTDDEPADDTDIDSMPMAGWRPGRQMMPLPSRPLPVHPSGWKPGAPQMNRDDILAAFQKFFADVPMNTRRFQQRALGIYKPDVTAIRVRVSKDLQVLLHELGHHVDKAVMQIRPARGTGVDRPVAVELETLGEATTPPSKMKDRAYKRKEGAAEYLRLWFVEPEKATAQAPKFTELFDAYLAANPALGTFFRGQQDQIQGLLAMTPDQELEERIDWNGEPGKLAEFRDWALGTHTDQRTGFQRMNDALNDDNLPFLRVEQAMEKGLPSGDYAESAYVAFRQLAGTSGQAQTYLEDAVRRADGTIMGPGLFQAVKDVWNTADYKPFVAYLVARRAQEYQEQGLETGIRPSTIHAKMSEAVPERFVDAAERVTSYWDTLMTWGVEHHYLSADMAAQMRARNTRYVPWERVMDAADQAFRSPGTKKQNTPQAIKRRTGSARRIVDPIVTSIKNTFTFVRTVEENAARLKLVDLVKEEGGAQFLERVTMKQVATRFNLDRVRGAILEVLSANGLEVGEDIPNDIDFDAAVTVFTPAIIAMGDSRIVTVLRDGKREWYEVHDDAIWETFVNAQPKTPGNLLTKAAIGAASLLRRTATSTLSFFSRNLVRDTIDAKTKAQYHHTFLKSLASAGLILKNDESWQRFRASKAAQASIVAVDRDYAKLEIKRFQHGALRRFLDVTVFNPFEGLRALAELSDNATRLQSFRETEKKLRKAGKTGEAVAVEASFTSRESTQDFAKMGSIVRRYNRYEAFLGARIGGYTRIATELGNPTKRTGYAFKAFLYGILPGLLLWALHRDDEEYAELPAWEKATYWHVPNGRGGWIRLPRPFDIGDVGNSLEAYLDWAVKHDPDAIQRLPFAGAAKPDLLKAFLSLAPTAVLPILEAAANYDTFRRRPIVSPFDLDLPLEQQYSQWTSSFSKRVGPAIGIAPAMLDHIIYGYTSATGQFISSLETKAEEMLGKVPPSPSRGWRDVPGVGAFVGQRATSQASSIEQFRRSKDTLELYQREINRHLKQNEKGEAAADKAAHPTLAADLKRLRAVDMNIRAITKSISVIRQRADITADEKRELYDRLYDRVIDLARRANGESSLPVRHAPIAPELAQKAPKDARKWLATRRWAPPSKVAAGAAGVRR